MDSRLSKLQSQCLFKQPVGTAGACSLLLLPLGVAKHRGGNKGLRALGRQGLPCENMRMQFSWLLRNHQEFQVTELARDGRDKSLLHSLKKSFSFCWCTNLSQPLSQLTEAAFSARSLL